jgi:Flp pilus assembly pilin Flp
MWRELMIKTKRMRFRPREGRAGEEGQALVEYALILTMIALVCIGALRILGANIDTFLTYIASQLTGIAGS